MPKTPESTQRLESADIRQLRDQVTSLQRMVHQLADASSFQNVLERGLEELSVKLEPLTELRDLRTLAAAREPLGDAEFAALQNVRLALARPNLTQLLPPEPQRPTSSFNVDQYGSTAS